MQREALNANAARSSQKEDLPQAQSRYLMAADGAAQWLEHIESLLGAGKDAELLDEWRRFRKAYPDYPVPQTTADRIKAIGQ